MHLSRLPRCPERSAPAAPVSPHGDGAGTGRHRWGTQTHHTAAVSAGCPSLCESTLSPLGLPHGFLHFPLFFHQKMLWLFIQEEKNPKGSGSFLAVHVWFSRRAGEGTGDPGGVWWLQCHLNLQDVCAQGGYRCWEHQRVCMVTHVGGPGCQIVVASQLSGTRVGKATTTAFSGTREHQGPAQPSTTSNTSGLCTSR